MLRNQASSKTASAARLLLVLSHPHRAASILRHWRLFQRARLRRAGVYELLALSSSNILAGRFASLSREQVDLRAILHFASPHDAPGVGTAACRHLICDYLAHGLDILDEFETSTVSAIWPVERCHPLCCVAPPTFDE